MGSLAAQSRQPVEIIGFNPSPCQGAWIGSPSFKRSVVSKKFSNDTTWIEVAVIANCQGVHSHQASFSNNQLMLSYHEGTTSTDTLEDGRTETIYSLAACECCFQFGYILKGLPANGYIIYVNGVRIE
jgi:hypothetical protein